MLLAGRRGAGCVSLRVKCGGGCGGGHVVSETKQFEYRTNVRQQQHEDRTKQLSGTSRDRTNELSGTSRHRPELISINSAETEMRPKVVM